MVPFGSTFALQHEKKYLSAGVTQALAMQNPGEHFVEIRATDDVWGIGSDENHATWSALGKIRVGAPGYG